MRQIIALALLALLPGCATIIEGSSQSVTVATTPPGAHCDVSRAGEHLGTVDPTPGSLHLDKSKNDITVACKETGYQPASVTETPKFVGTTFGNIVAGGLVGVAVDAATGANYVYPEQVKVQLAPLVPASAVSPVPAEPAHEAAPVDKAPGQTDPQHRS